MYLYVSIRNTKSLTEDMEMTFNRENRAAMLEELK